MSVTPLISTISEENFNVALKETGTLPLWKQMTRLNPPSPNPTAQAHVWEYQKIRPVLLMAGELVTEKQAERRVLMLVNPQMDAPYTTDTLYAGLQLVMPNETAPAHKHTAFAMRFIIEGTGGFTAVDGSRITMMRGDVIITPTWNWHDHGKDGSGPMIWLDGLDLPQFQHFPVHFVEHYEKPRYPADDIDSKISPLVFLWSEMKGRLDTAEGPWAFLPYQNKDGSEVSRVLGGSAERIDCGKSTPYRRETASSVCHVISGSGYSIISGVRFDWKQGDTFCVPSWNSYENFAGNERVYLYRFDDRPMMKSLGWYRQETNDPFEGYN